MTPNKEAKIQFYDGVNEPVVPEIRLTRDKNGTTGQAFFIFDETSNATRDVNSEDAPENLNKQARLYGTIDDSFLIYFHNIPASFLIRVMTSADSSKFLFSSKISWPAA